METVGVGLMAKRAAYNTIDVSCPVPDCPGSAKIVNSKMWCISGSLRHQSKYTKRRFRKCNTCGHKFATIEVITWTTQPEKQKSTMKEGEKQPPKTALLVSSTEF